MQLESKENPEITLWIFTNSTYSPRRRVVAIIHRWQIGNEILPRKAENVSGNMIYSNSRFKFHILFHLLPLHKHWHYHPAPCLHSPENIATENIRWRWVCLGRHNRRDVRGGIWPWNPKMYRIRIIFSTQCFPHNPILPNITTFHSSYSSIAYSTVCCFIINQSILCGNFPTHPPYVSLCSFCY